MPRGDKSKYTDKQKRQAEHIAESDRLAEAMQSPLLPLWSAEFAVQYRMGIGEWDAALALGERTIAAAKALNQRVLLPRLYVWTGLIYLWRGANEKAKEYFDLAWKLAAVLKGQAPESLLDTYQAERKHHLTEVTRRACRTGRIITERNRAVAVVRNHLLRNILRVPAVNVALDKFTWIPAARAFTDALRANGVGTVVSHANYLINLAGPADDLYAKSRASLAQELQRSAAYGLDHAIVHAGLHVAATAQNDAPYRYSRDLFLRLSK